jgi:hypothetical protein
VSGKHGRHFPLELIANLARAHGAASLHQDHPKSLDEARLAIAALRSPSFISFSPKRRSPNEFASLEIVLFDATNARHDFSASVAATAAVRRVLAAPKLGPLKR